MKKRYETHGYWLRSFSSMGSRDKGLATVAEILRGLGWDPADVTLDVRVFEKATVIGTPVVSETIYANGYYGLDGPGTCSWQASDLSHVSIRLDPKTFVPRELHATLNLMGAGDRRAGVGDSILHYGLQLGTIRSGMWSTSGDSSYVWVDVELIPAAVDRLLKLMFGVAEPVGQELNNLREPPIDDPKTVQLITRYDADELTKLGEKHGAKQIRCTACLRQLRVPELPGKILIECGCGEQFDPDPDLLFDDDDDEDIEEDE